MNAPRPPASAGRLRSPRRRWLARQAPWMGGAALIACLAIGGWWVVSRMQAVAPPEEPRVQQISILQPPPPPPPPPEVEEPPPKVEEIVEPEPEPEPLPEEPEAPPISEELGLDAEGAAGADGFGLRAKKGGRELIGGGGGNAVVWFGQRLGSELSEALRAALDPALAQRGFSVEAAIWVAPDGRLERAELARGSGDPALDEALRRAFGTLRLQVAATPPPDMPQPVRLRLRARG